MKLETEEMISVTELSAGTSRVIKAVSAGHKRVVMRNNKPAAAIVPIADVERLDNIDEAIEDLRLVCIALVRTFTDDGERYGLEEVAEEFGVDLDTLGDTDDGEDE